MEFQASCIHVTTGGQVRGPAAKKQRSICQVLKILGVYPGRPPGTLTDPPHRLSESSLSSRLERIAAADFVVADVTTPNTELGVELGYAFAFGVPIVAVFQTPARIPPLVLTLCMGAREYETELELLKFFELTIRERQLDSRRVQATRKPSPPEVTA